MAAFHIELTLQGLTWTSNPTPDDQAFESMKYVFRWRVIADCQSSRGRWSHQLECRFVRRTSLWHLLIVGTFYGEDYVNLKLLNRFFEKVKWWIDVTLKSVPRVLGEDLPFSQGFLFTQRTQGIVCLACCALLIVQVRSMGN